MRTRSGRSTRRTDSPLGTSKSRISKSPATKSKKDKKSSKLDKSKTPKLTAPLSVLTKDMEVPLKDMDSWVHRPADVRRKEAEKRNGYVTRPMNSFMLYRSCYAERTKQWCLQNNHQVVSSVSGESWPMEPEDVRNQFNEWAKIERANHAAAHPEYKFSPSKTSKRKKGEHSDDEDEGSELDGDPDGEYRGGSRSVRQKRLAQQHAPALAYLPSNVGFDSHPYYGQQYEQPHYAYTSDPSRQLPSNVAFDASAAMFDHQTGTWVQAAVYPQAQYNYMPATTDIRSNNLRVATPSSMTGVSHGLGGYGLPGGPISAEDLFGSRTSTPAMQMHYNQFGLPINHQQYHSHTPQISAYQAPPPAPQQHSQQQQQQQQMYEHARYLQQASQPQAIIDPSLEAALAAGGPQEHSHFDDAMEDFPAGPINGDIGGMDQYFEEPASASTMAPMSWSGQELGTL